MVIHVICVLSPFHIQDSVTTMGCVSAKTPSQQHLESADGQGSMSEAELPRPFDSEDYATLIHDALENSK